MEVDVLKSVTQAYLDYAKTEFPKKEINRLYVELDHKIALALAEDGYSTYQIEQAILYESPVIEGKSSEEKDRYLRGQVPRDLPENGLEITVKNAYIAKKESLHVRFEDLFFKKDLNIFCKLLDDGYSLKEVLEAHRKKSLLSTQFTNEKLLNNYADNILGHVNRERILRTGKLYELAKKLYLEKINSLSDKYASYSKDKFNAFHEGSIVISMMIDHNFFPEVIEEVLRRNSIFVKVDENYIRDVMEKCRSVQQAYIDIQRMVAPHDVRSEQDAYRYFAREYMMHTHTKILSGRDDQSIVARMYTEKFPKEIILSALLKASPVAMEPGRNKDKYVTSLINLVEKEYADKKEYALKQYPVTAALYEEKIGRLDQRLKEKGYSFGVEKNRSYYDAMVARELLEEKQSSANISRVIIEKSPLAIKKNPLNPDKTPENYANWIVSAAKKVIRAEKNLLAWENKAIPNNTNYKNLIEAGITPIDLFKQALHERITTYPSISARLTAPFIDKDIAEKLLTRYPDFDKFQLHEVIKHNSPRALMPGIPENYVVKLIDDVEKRIESAQKKESYTKTVQEEYNRQCGLASEGVNIDSHLSLYQDGRAALRMLLNHIDPLDVRNAIVAAAQTAAVITPLLYADTVLQGAEAVYRRINELKEYKTVENPKSVEEVYKNKLVQLYNEKKFLQSSMDVEIMKDMLLENQYRTSEIKRAIQEASPIAIEPGRDNKYESFIESQAKEKIAQERLKLHHYKPIPRIEHEESAKLEYERHSREIQKSIDLPFSAQMDLLIAETMLIQGYSSQLITEVLQESPCVESQKNYATAIVRKAENSLTKDRDQEQVLVRSIKKVTETTTKITEN